MKKYILALGVVLTCCMVAPSPARAANPTALREALRKLADWIRDIDTTSRAVNQLRRWIDEAMGGRTPSNSLRCRRPDETIRTVTRKIQELTPPPVLDRKDSRYKTDLNKDSPQALWQKDAAKLIAYNLDLRKQIKAMKQVEDEFDRVIREAKRVKTVVEVVSSSQKRLESKIQAAKQIEKMMNESFACAWKDLERGLLANLKELITQAENKKRAFAAAQAAQERVLREHTAFLLAEFRKHGISAPSEIR